jgi:hypothetical protein
MHPRISVISRADGLRVALQRSVFPNLEMHVLPVALTMIPILIVTPLGNENFHQFMIWLVLPTSSLAFTLGCRHHKDLIVIILGFIGLMLIGLGAFWVVHAWDETGERVFTILGGLVLAFAHFRNHHLCRSDDCES